MRYASLLCALGVFICFAAQYIVNGKLECRRQTDAL